MKQRTDQSRSGDRGRNLLDSVRRSFGEFLLLPTAVLVGFLVMAVASFGLDKAQLSVVSVLRATMTQYVFGGAEATTGLLSSLVAGLITLMSITFSVLLLAVQQAAAALSSQVIDQFLRRRLNQLFFGYFVGLTVYCLIVLSTVQPDFNPVIGATVALMLSVGALYGLVLLIYMTVNQLRPANIVRAIHNRTLLARERQRRDLTGRTRRRPRSTGAAPVSVTATENGFLVDLDVEELARAARGDGPGEGEVLVCPSVGHYVSYGDVVAQVWPPPGRSRTDVECLVRRGLSIGSIRSVDLDPSVGAQQLTDIGWTTISTSKQSPDPGRLAVMALRDLLARWADQPEEPPDRPLPVVYRDDVPDELLNGLELLAVVSTESLQVNAFVEVLRTVAVLFDRLPVEQQARCENLVLRSLSGMGDHVLTAPLDSMLSNLVHVLRDGDRLDTAAAVDRARRALAESVGHLHARGGRAPADK